MLWGIIKWEKPLSDWLTSKSILFQVALGFIDSLIMIIIGLLVRFLIAGASDPASYSSFSADARSITHFFTLSGALFGTVSGYALMRQHARFEAGFAILAEGHGSCALGVWRSWRGRAGICAFVPKGHLAPWRLLRIEPSLHASNVRPCEELERVREGGSPAPSFPGRALRRSGGNEGTLRQRDEDPIAEALAEERWSILRW